VANCCEGAIQFPVIGFINGSSATAYAAYGKHFRGLAETGHTVGEMSRSNKHNQWKSDRAANITPKADVDPQWS
jgi:hypothetical protein